MTTPEQPPDIPPRAAPLALWRAMRAFLATLFSLFGAPEDIAAMGVMRREQYALFVPWLRAGEAFLRRLLFIEAAALCDTTRTTTTARKPRQREPRKRRLVSSYPDKPADWPVAFRVLESARGRRERTRRGVRREPIELAPAFFPEPSAPEKTHAVRAPSGDERIRAAQTSERYRLSLHFPNAWPIAERLEAMLRAFNDPHPHARRLARALQRNADCAARVLRPQSQRTAQLFGARAFTLCDKLTAARHRKWPPKPASPDTG